MRNNRARALRDVAAALIMAGALAGCGGSAHHQAAGTNGKPATSTPALAPTGRTSTTTGPASTASPESTAPPAPTPSTLPAPATSGALSVEATIPVPVTPDGAYPPVAAEAPDGAVFVSDPTKSVVWVVDGDQPAAVAEHVAGITNSLAADAGSLYIATFSTVYRYDRTTGSQVQQWTLPAVKRANASDELLVSLTVSHGTLWVFITQGQDVDAYRIDPNSAAPPQRVVTSLGAVVGSDGSLYYERTDSHLVRLAPAGGSTVGAPLANHPNGLGGGVQMIESIAAGQVWATEPAGQGLDASYRAFGAQTLSPGATLLGTVGTTMLDTLAGSLALSGNEDRSCPVQARCVLRIDGHAGVSDPLPVGAALQLLGPYPAVVTSNSLTAAPGVLQVRRLS